MGFFMFQEAVKTISQKECMISCPWPTVPETFVLAFANQIWRPCYGLLPINVKITILNANSFILFWGLHCCVGFSVIAESRSYSPVEEACPRLLIAGTALVAEQGILGSWASVLWLLDSGHRLS